MSNPIPAFQGEHLLTRPIADLRRHHAAYTKNGYTRNLIPPAVVAPREKALPPHVAAMLRTLEDGSALTPARRRPVGWTVTSQDVRLHDGPTGELLDRAAVVELQAALSAWLHFTKDTGQPASQGDSPTSPRRSRPEPGAAGPVDGHARTQDPRRDGRATRAVTTVADLLTRVLDVFEELTIRTSRPAADALKPRAQTTRLQGRPACAAQVPRTLSRPSTPWNPPQGRAAGPGAGGPSPRLGPREPPGRPERVRRPGCRSRPGRRRRPPRSSRTAFAARRRDPAPPVTFFVAPQWGLRPSGPA